MGRLAGALVDTQLEHAGLVGPLRSGDFETGDVLEGPEQRALVAHVRGLGARPLEERGGGLLEHGVGYEVLARSSERLEALVR